MKQGDFVWYRGELEDGTKIKGVFDYTFNTFDVENLSDYLVRLYPAIRFAKYSHNKSEWIKLNWLEDGFSITDDCPKCGGKINDLDGVGVCDKCGTDLEWDEEIEGWIEQ